MNIADTILHIPTGETWVIAKVTDTHIYPAGWPPCRADIKDCKLIKEATKNQREEMIHKLKLMEEK